MVIEGKGKGVQEVVKSGNEAALTTLLLFRPRCPTDQPRQAKWILPLTPWQRDLSFCTRHRQKASVTHPLAHQPWWPLSTLDSHAIEDAPPHLVCSIHQLCSYHSRFWSLLWRFSHRPLLALSQRRQEWSRRLSRRMVAFCQRDHRRLASRAISPPDLHCSDEWASSCLGPSLRPASVTIQTRSASCSSVGLHWYLENAFVWWLGLLYLD